MKHRIVVPTVGTIDVCPDVRREDHPMLGDVTYSRVQFTGFGDRFDHDSVRLTRDPFNLWYAVRHALFAMENRPDYPHHLDWWVSTEVPIGTARVSRDAYHVVSADGYSDRTDGKQRRKTVKLTRGMDEPIIEAVFRCIGEWSGWEGAGTFDCVDSNHYQWRTVPVEATETTRGIPCVEHVVTWSGEVEQWLDAMVVQAKESGVMWR